MKKIKLIKQFLIAVLVSILIGFSFLLVFGGFNRPIKDILLNMGYSLCIGLPLFANGFLFEWYAKRYIDWIKKPLQSIFSAMLLHFTYSSIVILGVNWIWFVRIPNSSWDIFWQHNKATIISEYIVFVVVASIIYAINFFKAWKFALEEKEKIKSESLALKYKVLQDQVSPHFLFNSLNTLGSLIDLDTAKAKVYNQKLAQFYRDLLLFKDEDIIGLKEEVEFVKKYVYLQQIRFGEALAVDIIPNDKVDGKVIPLSLQTLVENCIKHNEISIANPLKIVIGITDDHKLIVENNLQPKSSNEKTSSTGLNNLAGRYEFLTGKKVKITKTGKYFRVNLPLILMED